MNVFDGGVRLTQAEVVALRKGRDTLVMLQALDASLADIDTCVERLENKIIRFQSRNGKKSDTTD